MKKMLEEPKSVSLPWQQVFKNLRIQLLEAEETLEAIAQQRVDAFVISGPREEQVYTLRGTDHAYRVILETINEGAATLGVDSTVYYCNPAFATLLQLPLDQVIGTSLISFVNPEDLPLYLSLIEQGSIDRSKGEIMLHTARGNRVPVLLSCSSLKMDEVPGVCLVATDLTEQRRQAEIIAAEQLTRSILEQASEAMVVCDGEGQIIRANRKAHELCGRNPILHQFDEAFSLYRHVTDELSRHQADKESLTQLIQAVPIQAVLVQAVPVQAATAQPIENTTHFSFATDLNNLIVQNQEVMLVKPGGELCYLLLSSATLLDGEQQPLGSVITLVDITRHKQMEDTLRQARHELEQRVIDRTHELLESNLCLQQEIETRAQTEAALTEARSRLRQGQETERMLLARELHDGPLQEVIGMAFDLLLLTQTLQEEDQIEKVTAISNAVQKTARHLRLVAQTLRPPVLAYLGLAAALRAHIKQVQEINDTPRLGFVTSEEKWSVPEEAALALLRIGQQALQNALQHAKANRVQIRLEYDDMWIRLEIEDDGQGFKMPAHRVEFAREGHLGVIGMAERAEAIGGKFEVISQPGHGTCIRITVPKVK